MTDVMLFPNKPSESDQSIVDILEDMLADARRGEIVSLVAVTSRRSDSTGMAIRCDSAEAALKLLGSVELAKFRLLGMMSEDVEE